MYDPMSAQVHEHDRPFKRTIKCLLEYVDMGNEGSDVVFTSYVHNASYCLSVYNSAAQMKQ